MKKELKFNEVARRKIKEGIDITACAVKGTLGPRGKNVIFKNRNSNNVVVTNDGVTIAKEIELEDEFQNIGSVMVKEAATQTNEEAGDGTTTATVLVQAITKRGLRNIEAGSDPMLIRKGIKKATDIAIEEIKEIAKEVKTKEEMKQVATISAQDEEIGGIIAEAMDTVGKDGVITVENSNGFKVEAEVVTGMLIKSGYISPFMVGKDKTKAELDNPFILVTDKKFSSVNEIVPILEKMLTQLNNKSLLIIAGSIEGEALGTIIVNKLKGIADIVGIAAPDFGDNQKEILEDIAVLTGGVFVSEEKGMQLDKADGATLKDYFGKARKVTVKADETIIIGGKGKESEINSRVEKIQKQVKETDNDQIRETLKERYAKLVSGVGVIRVGATTQVEAIEKMYKVEDALNATRAAVEEGIVPGGGVALIRAKEVLDANEKKIVHEDIELGMKILADALEAPMRQMLANAGVKDIGTIIEQLNRSKDNSSGFDFKDIDKSKDIGLIDAISEGIVDPAKVVITALRNAASVASSVLTTDVAIVEKEIDKEK